MNKQTANKAAKWWADFLRNGAPLDNGEKSGISKYVARAGYSMQSESKPSSDKIDAFEKALADAILENNITYITVDYSPDITLMAAAKNVGLVLEISSLPWKTTMRINQDNSILVGVGLGSKLTDLE